MTDKTEWEGQAQNPTPRACTCHPDDRPAGPCPKRFAAGLCQFVALEAERDALREALVPLLDEVKKLHFSVGLDPSTSPLIEAARQALAISEKSE